MYFDARDILFFMIAALLKFGKTNHILDSFRNDYLYFSPLMFFRSSNKDKFGMFDPREGNLKIIQGKRLTVTIKGKELHLHDMFKNFDCQYQEYPTKISGNVCSLHMLVMEEMQKTFSFDDRLYLEDGKALLIYDVPRLFNSIDESLRLLDMGFQRADVIYYDPKTLSGDLSFFHKDKSFDFQNEYRILLKTPGNSPVKIKMADLKEYSIVLDFETLKAGITIIRENV